jgi:hypothetical protein
MMSQSPEQGMIQHVIGVQQHADALYMLLTIYHEADALNATGHIFRQGLGRDDPAHYLLQTNDPIGSLWCSPEGDLWAGSASGHVWTSAPVAWPPLGPIAPVFQELDPSLTWQVTALPGHHPRGLAPNVTTLWGFSNTNVFAGTFRGSIYHWDGQGWYEYPSGFKACINRIHGLHSDAVYAVGYNGAISYFDGSNWIPLQLPPGQGPNPTFTGVRVIEQNRVLVCSSSGQILVGDYRGFTLLGQFDVELYGIGLLDDRVILASGNDGVFELTDDQLTLLKDNCATVAVFETPNRLFFAEPMQDPGPRVIEFDPNNAAPWTRRSY